MYNKRGSGHLEMILSFLLFVGFIGATIYFINPFENKSDLTPSLDKLQKNILKKTEIEVNRYSIKLVKELPSGSWIKIKIPMKLEECAFVLDYYGNPSDSTCDQSGVTFQINIEKFYQIYVSEDIDKKNIVITDYVEDEDAYQIVGVLDQTMISEKKLKDLASEIDSNYQETKKELGVDLKYDFSFESFSGNNKIIGNVNNPTNFEVYRKTIRQEFLYQSGNRGYEILGVSIW